VAARVYGYGMADRDQNALTWGAAREINRARWDELATIHEQTAYYDTTSLIRGRDTLTEEEDEAIAAAVGDVSGRSVLHVQCHLGFDAISLARRGARVTGVDFSAPALARAAELAKACGVDVEWVEGDSTALPFSLDRRFDLAYATVGVITWIGELGAWMRSVYSTLRPGGRLVLIDGHPLQDMVEVPEPLRLDFPYGGGRPMPFDTAETYADPSLRVTNTAGVNYAHSIGEIITAAAGAGFRIDELTEHLSGSFQYRPGIETLEDDGRWRLRIAGQPMPVLFTLQATRPA
jgi:SAM-dependent methyltransferase